MDGSNSVGIGAEELRDDGDIDGRAHGDVMKARRPLRYRRPELRHSLSRHMHLLA